MGRDTKLTYAGVLREGVALAVGFRHAIWLMVGVVWLASPPRPLPSLVATVLLTVWSALRLYGRRSGPWWECADLAVVLAYLAVPAAAATSMSQIGGGSLVKVAAAALISFGIALPWRWSAASALAVPAALFIGYRNVPDLDASHFLSTFAIGYLPVVWALAVIARRIVLRAADGVDTSLAALAEARVLGAVSAARRRHEREQWAILHDTAASTLLLIGAGTPIATERLAVQAHRDLTVLEAGVPVFDETDDQDVDLVVMLAEPIRACRTPVTVRAPATLPTRPAVAWAVTAAVREALTNVDRHARAESVLVRVDSGRVTVADDGIGFAGPPDSAAARHGIRRSIIDRMSAAGAAAAVTGAVGDGTRVELTWPSSRAEITSGGDPSDIVTGVDRLETGLGFAIAGIAVIDTLVQSSRAWSLPEPVPPIWVDVVLAGTNVACAVTAVLAVRRRLTTTARLMAVAVGVSILLSLLLPANQVLGGANWSIGAVGWTVVALGLRGPRAVTVTALLVWWLLAGAVILIRSPDQVTVILLGYQTAAILFAQVFTALFAASVYRVVRVVTGRDRERQRIVAAAAVDKELKQECERRYRDQLRSVLPVLRGIADGTLSPESAQVKSTASTEYARLRRLFARADSMDHPLLADTGTAVGRAESRGVQVTVEAAPDLPDVSDAARGEVRTAVRILLDSSRSRARIAVTAEPGALTVSVVCDAPPVAAARAAEIVGDSGEVAAELVVDEESRSVWLRLRCAGTDTERRSA